MISDGSGTVQYTEGTASLQKPCLLLAHLRSAMPSQLSNMHSFCLRGVLDTSIGERSKEMREIDAFVTRCREDEARNGASLVVSGVPGGGKTLVCALM